MTDRALQDREPPNRYPAIGALTFSTKPPSLMNGTVPFGLSFRAHGSFRNAKPWCCSKSTPSSAQTHMTWAKRPQSGIRASGAAGSLSPQSMSNGCSWTHLADSAGWLPVNDYLAVRDWARGWVTTWELTRGWASRCWRRDNGCTPGIQMSAKVDKAEPCTSAHRLEKGLAGPSRRGLTAQRGVEQGRKP